MTRSKLPFRPRASVLALEPRVLFDGAGAIAAVDHLADASAPAERAKEVPAGQTPTAAWGSPHAERWGMEATGPEAAGPTLLLVVDARVADQASLLAGLPANAVLRVVDSGESGLNAVSQALAGLQGIESVQIISHGTPGSFTLGSDTVDAASVAAHGAQLQAWAGHLTADADILLYGCDVGQGAQGQALLTQLAALTGADIAASTNATGTAAKGGDWVLERNTGAIEAGLAVSHAATAGYGELLADPVATTSVTVDGASTSLIGSDITLKVAFDNTGGAVGYGPFVDLFIGHKGADGSTTNLNLHDGLNFKSASYFGTPVESTLYTLTNGAPAAGQLQIVGGNITHPITGQPFAVPSGFAAGDQLLVLTLPFGSFTPTQPAAAVDVVLTIDAKADPGTALNLASRGGYMFGKDPLNNPATDPVIYGAVVSSAITPKAFDVETRVLAPEGETATGPNFVRQVEVVITPAAGTTLSDATRFQFTLPDGMVLADNFVLPAGWVLDTTPSYDNSTANDTLVLTRVAGQTISAPTTILVPVYVTEKFQTGADVLTAATGNATTITIPVNAIKVTDGQWAGVAGSTLVGAGKDVLPVNVGNDSALTLVARSVQIIKEQIYKNGAGTALGTGGTVRPGDSLEYRLQVDVSDFFRTGSVVVTDELPDGMTFDKGFVPTLNVNWKDATGADRTATVSFSADNVEVLSADGTNWTALSDFSSDLATQTATGKTHFRFNLSSQLNGMAPEQLVGGLVNTGDGTTQGTQNQWVTNGTAGTGATTATIAFKAKVEENYRTVDPLASGITNQNLKERDVLGNKATVAVDILARPTGDEIADQSDDSSESVTLPSGKVNLEIASVTRNGVLTAWTTGMTLAPGDKVTYKLTYDLPLADYENLQLDAYLPMPVFGLAPGALGQDSSNGDNPDANQWNFGTGTTGSPNATVTVGDNNKVTFDLGDSGATNSNVPGKIEIVFSATVTSDPFADRLKLTAQGQHQDSSSQNQAGTTTSVNQIVLGQADVQVYKGYTNKNDTQTGVTGQTFVAGSALTSSTISNIGASNASRFDGGDTVRVTIAVENQGTSAKGAFNVEVKDALDGNLTANASTLKFYKGDGSPVTQVEIKVGAAWTVTNVAGNEGAILAALHTGDGVRFIDGADGALGRGKDDAGASVTTGANVIYLSYDATVKSSAAPNTNSDSEAAGVY